MGFFIVYVLCGLRVFVFLIFRFFFCFLECDTFNIIDLLRPSVRRQSLNCLEPNLKGELSNLDTLRFSFIKNISPPAQKYHYFYHFRSMNSILPSSSNNFSLTFFLKAKIFCFSVSSDTNHVNCHLHVFYSLQK